MRSSKATTLIIVGITGDLSQRMLLPAIEKIAKANMLPEQFQIIGISRKDVSAADVVDETLGYVRDHTEMLQMDLDSPHDYQVLKEKLESIDGTHSDKQRLFYLSVPPTVSTPIISHLGESGLADSEYSKLLLEKPFGTDHASAKDLVTHIEQYFDESQIYRIDHFVAKEMAQNIIVFRSGNSLFRRTWNNGFIASIDIIASETLDIEGRVAMYEQTGALRDLVQSHLMQLAALTLMELPQIGHWQDIPQQRYRALSALTPAKDAKRAQYEGYRSEVNNDQSMTETFASVTLFSDDPAWQGVPIRLITGKAMKEKYTEIRIHYTPEHDEREANDLTIRINPDEGISFCIWTKKPGYDHQPELTPMKFTYAEHFDTLPFAYEKVFVDAMNGDHSLFTTSREVLESWRVLQPVIDRFEADKEITHYEKGAPIETLLA